MKHIKCFCGKELILIETRNCCNNCSTVYTDSGSMILNRHNWNIKEYSLSFQKETLNLPKNSQS